MDIEDLAKKIEEKIYQTIVLEAGGEDKILYYSPTIRISENDKLHVDIELELEISPLAKKTKEEIIEKVREEVDKLIQKLTGKKPD